MSPTADDTATLPAPTSLPLAAPGQPGAASTPASPTLPSATNDMSASSSPVVLPSLPESGVPSGGLTRAEPIGHAAPSTPSMATLSLDGDLPRLATASSTHAPAGPAPTATVPTLADSTPTLADSSPTLTPTSPPSPSTASHSTAVAPTPFRDLTDPAPILPTLPTQSAPNLAATPSPTLPATPPHDAPKAADTIGDDGSSDGDAASSSTNPHPMAHLMPEKMALSESSMKAAQIRAAKKAKAKKVKIGVAIGVLAVTALVGPPLFKWFSDALNEAGSTSTEEPAE